MAVQYTLTGSNHPRLMGLNNVEFDVKRISPAFYYLMPIHKFDGFVF